VLVVFLQVDQRVFKDLMSEKLPRLHAHFEQNKVDFSLITFNWFLVVFVDSLVSDILFKIWDAFLYEGPKVSEPESDSDLAGLSDNSLCVRHHEYIQLAM